MNSLPTALECVWLWASPPLDSFWCWSRDHEALEWADADAGTLLLRSELQDFVRHRVTAGRGLPPLQLVVVLLALLRDPKRLQEQFPDVDLPPTGTLWQQVRSAPALRLHLIDAVTWAAKPNSLEFASRVAEGLDVELPFDHLEPRDFRTMPVAEAIELLRLGLRAVTPERLALWAKTGLAELPEPAELPLPPPRDARELLAQLAGDPRFGGLVGVVRQLQAALRVPSRPLRRDEQATDGFVGVGNRGPLDRLLPSELAHDDDVLAVRIATNEALYVQREAPPRRPRARRRILLDDGVRMWGTPRVLGVAVALAFLASAPRDLEVEVWRNHGGRLERIALASRDDLVQQLGRLDLALDARAVLPAFWAGGAGELGGPVVGAVPSDVHDEAIVVAHADSVADPQFCPRALAGLPRQRRHLAAVDEFGLCTMAELTAHGREVGGQVGLRLPGVWPTTASPRPAPVGRMPVPQFCRGPLPCAEPPACARHAALFVQAIAVVGGRIVIRRRGAPQALYRYGSWVVFQAFAPKGWEQFPWHPFAPVVGAESTPSGEPCAVAELGPHSSVFLDRRGFLHFQSSDVEGPEEVSLPLVYGGQRLLGWRIAWEILGSEPPRNGSLAGGPCVDRELWAWIERIVREAS
jgi:hypothetical protein